MIIRILRLYDDDDDNDDIEQKKIQKKILIREQAQAKEKKRETKPIKFAILINANSLYVFLHLLGFCMIFFSSSSSFSTKIQKCCKIKI